MKVSLVFAASKNGVIGKDNTLPWVLKDDMKLFREITAGRHVLMGRKTFESIGRPLPNRVNLVVSRNPSLSLQGVRVFNEVAPAVDFARESGETELMVIGGVSLYEEALKIADRVYLTRVDAEVQGDVKFDFEPDPASWEQVGEARVYAKDERNEYPFTHVVYERKRQ